MPSTAALVVAALAATLVAPATADIPTAEEIADILDAHNAARSSVSPTASNMAKLVWDPTLAAAASSYSDRCVWGHNSARPSGTGENIAVGSRQTARGAVDAWVDEVNDWTYAAVGRDCNRGAVCGHYTQIVWATTTAVGCGRTYCPSLQGLSFGGFYTVCNYAPAGNYPRVPYVSGPTCSACPASHSACIDGLCVDPDTIDGPIPPADDDPSSDFGGGFGGSDDGDDDDNTVGGDSESPDGSPSSSSSSSTTAVAAAGAGVAFVAVGAAGYLGVKKWGKPTMAMTVSLPSLSFRSNRTPYISDSAI